MARSKKFLLGVGLNWRRTGVPAWFRLPGATLNVGGKGGAPSAVDNTGESYRERLFRADPGKQPGAKGIRSRTRLLLICGVFALVVGVGLYALSKG